MRSVIVEETGVDGSADWSGLCTPADYLTRASVTVDVTGASGLDGVVSLYASNEKPPSYIRQTQFVPSSSSQVAGGSVQVTGDGAYSFALDIAYRYVAVVYTWTAGSGTLDIRLSLKGWP